jgi:hypothetical protein
MIHALNIGGALLFLDKFRNNALDNTFQEQGSLA